MKFEKLITEETNAESKNLDILEIREAAELMNRMDGEVTAAVKAAIPQISVTVEEIAKAFKKGGRLIYCGAGTSGRLGVLDASECPPTFGVSPDMVVGIIAGGDKALRFPIEGAEDSPEGGKADMIAANLNKNDVLVAISASGYAPYCVGALDYANEIGAFTGCIVCVPDSNLSKHAKSTMAAVVGPEILSGSTRLRAGTATKMILNMLTTLSMVQIGKVYQNLMVDMVPSNTKLYDRAKRIVSRAAQVSKEEAADVLTACDGYMKAAIVCIKAGVSPKTARQALDDANGFVRKAIEICKSKF